MSKTVPEVCPHCGGKNGLYYTVKQTYDQYFQWNGENEGPSEHMGPQIKTAYCIDCRRIVTKYAKRIRPFNRYNGSIQSRTYDMGDSIV